jgi:F-type H+-transporting ATPase subunit alpha
LKQAQYSPLAVEEQVAVIFAGVRGYVDSVPVNKVTAFEAQMLAKLRAEGSEILTAIRTEQSLSGATEEKLKSFLAAFVKTFAA